MEYIYIVGALDLLTYFTPNLHSWLTTSRINSAINLDDLCFLHPLIMYAPIVLHGHIDAPICEKPRLFSHWKPSLAQVTSDFDVHSPSTLRVRALYP